MSETLLQMNHIRKHFGDLHVLEDISIEVHRGEVVSIIGPSGSGKSTLLRCATLLEKMDGGDLIYLGEAAAKEENGKCVYASRAKLKQIRKYFGLVFQNFNLFPHYTVLKNITDAPVCVDKVPKEEAVERAKKLLEQLGLADKANAYPCQLSGGQQQRVSIARTLVQQADIILADEPVASLDPVTTQKIMKDLQNINKGMGKTVIVNIHSVELARTFSTRIIALKAGKMVFDGTPEELTDQKLIEIYGKVI